MTAVVSQDHVAAQSDFLDDVIQGLSAPAKYLDAKYFYDEVGSSIYGEITRLDLNYDWSDHWAFSANVVLYAAKPTAMLAPYNGNDSVNMSAKYQF